MSIFRKKRERKGPPKVRRQLSLPLMFAVPSTFLIGWLAIVILLRTLERDQFRWTVWSAFLSGAAGTWMLLERAPLRKLRTFIHESKHAVLVNLIGGKVKKFEVSSDEGLVEYEINKDQSYLTPLIALAPYFLPLFSLPTFCLAIYFGEDYPLLMGAALGMSLAIDLSGALGEMRPEQTDFRTVIGGFALCGCYLAGFHFMWCSLCLLWVANGQQAFIDGSQVLLGIVEYLVLEAHPRAVEAVHRLLPG